MTKNTPQTPKKVARAKHRIRTLVQDLVRQDQIFAEMTQDAVLLAQEGVQRLMPQAKQWFAECQALTPPKFGREAFAEAQKGAEAAYGALDAFLKQGHLPNLALDKNSGYGLLSAYLEEKTGRKDRAPGYGVRNQARALDFLRQRGRSVAVKSIADYLYRRVLEQYTQLEAITATLQGKNKKLARLLGFKPFFAK